MTLAQDLADFVHRTETLPGPSRDMAIRAMSDLMTAAVAGFESPGGRSARRAGERIWGAGPASVWFSSTRATVPGAGFANAAAASMLDLDDGHRAAAGHPGACIIPAVLATAEACGADAERVLTAIALGYEVAIRVAASRDLSCLDTLVTGPWCGQGAAAAAAWLRRLPSRQIAQAMAIAGVSAPNLAAVAYSREMGNHVKEGIPWATATGLSAVDLAATGFTAPLDLWDNETLYDPTRLTAGLGQDWMIDSTYFKPYGCCRWAHAAIDGLIGLQAETGVRAADIASIRVHTFARALKLNNDLAPETLEAAQYSVPFCLALAAVRGVEALLPLTATALADREVLDLARRVRITIDPALDAMFSRAVPARVELDTTAGRLTRTITDPLGEPGNPMTRSDLATKFTTATDGLIDPGSAALLTRALERLDVGELQPLLAALAAPLKPEEPAQTPGSMVQNA